MLSLGFARERDAERLAYDASKEHFAETAAKLEELSSATEDLWYGRGATIDILDVYYRQNDGRNLERAAEIQTFIDKGIFKEILFEHGIAKPIISDRWCELSEDQQTRVASTLLHYYMSEFNSQPFIKFGLGDAWLFGSYRSCGWSKNVEYEHDFCRLAAEDQARRGNQ